MKWSHQNNTNHGQVIISNITCYDLAIDKNGDIYVSDDEKNEVRRWKKGEKQGIIVAGGNGQGNSLTQLFDSQELFVDQLGQIYVANSWNHRIIPWCKEDKQGTVGGGENGKGQGLNQLNFPRNLSFDRQGNLYVADQENNQIQNLNGLDRFDF
jgi:sugar lactone lactonase YvrE